MRGIQSGDCDPTPSSRASSHSTDVVDLDRVMLVIDDAREEEIQRRLRQTG
jgi:hypothetical protein